MAKLEWLETFELGVPEIDDDHREILAIMKSVEAAAETENYDLCADLLDKLIEFSAVHFKREEALLRKVGYPGVDMHEEYHSELVGQASAVKDVCKRIKSRENFQECCSELFGFLVDDIVAGDLKFKSFLETKGVTKGP